MREFCVHEHTNVTKYLFSVLSVGVRGGVWVCNVRIMVNHAYPFSAPAP